MRQPPQDLLPRHAQILAAEGDLAGGVHVEELGAGILEHAAHLPCRVPQGLPGHVFAAHMHAAGQLPLEIVGDQTVDKPCHSGLTAAALAAQNRHLSLRDGQVNVPDASGGVRLIGKCHMVHMDHPSHLLPNVRAKPAIQMRIITMSLPVKPDLTDIRSLNRRA